MKITKIEPLLFEEERIPLFSDGSAVEIEITSVHEIDCGIMDDENYRKFAVADSDEGIEKVAWRTKTKSAMISFIPPSLEIDYWLILFNAYSEEDVYAAYAISSENIPSEDMTSEEAEVLQAEVIN